MASQIARRELISSLSESDFRSEVLVPLLKKLKFQNVIETHGRDEYGKDITFSDSTALGVTYYAVVAKIGDISGAASGKGNLATIKSQIDMAFDIPIETTSGSERHRVNKVYVWTTGNISQQAQRQIISSLSDKFRNVEFKDGKETISLLEEHYPSYFTIRDPYVSDYFAAAKELYSRLEELRALGGSSEKLRLPVVFVPPTLTTFEKNNSENSSSRKEIYSFQQIMNSPDSFLITGGAGSGKSSLLRRLLLSIIEDNEMAVRRIPIPIIVELKNLDLLDQYCIEKAVNAEFLRFDSSGLAAENKTDIPDGDFIVLLDALDELKDEAKIVLALKHVESFIKKHPQTRLVLTSRLLSILKQPDILSDLKTLRIQDLSTDQMVQFVQNWYPNDTETARKLIGFIKQPATLRGLPATPLTLALVAILYQSGSQEIPANLTELFQKYTELALGRWDDNKALAVQFEWRIKEFLLRKISWSLHIRNKSSITSVDFKSTLEQFSSERGLEIDSAIFQNEIIDRSELMYQTDDDEIEFKHRALQDYFVGAEIVSRVDAVEYIVSKILDGRWSDAVFFACGLRPESEDYLNAIMDRVEVTDGSYLSFAVSLGLVTQAVYLAPKAAKSRATQRVIDLLVQGWDELAKQRSESGDGDISRKGLPPHIFFLAVYSLFDQMAIGSVTLIPTLVDLTKSYLEDKSEFADLREEAIHEWYGYFLAIALIECDQIDAFKSIVESGKIDDPSMLFLLRVFTREAVRRTWLNQREQNELKTLDLRLSKKLKKSRKYLTSLNRMKPIALPEVSGVSTADSL